MLAEDYLPNRLEAAKGAAKSFVDAFSGQANIGVATFTGTTFIKEKITDNKGDVKDAIEDITIEEVGGTAIGDAMVTASNLLFTKKEGNVLVILTDGQSNVGLHPSDAIAYLDDKKILVYTVGIGTVEGGAFIQGSDIVSRLNEEVLQTIASETGGEYFRADNTNELKEAFSKIAKSKTKRLSYHLSITLMLTGLSLLLIEWSLMNTKFRSIP